MVTPMMSHEKIIEQKIGHEKKLKKKKPVWFYAKHTNHENYIHYWEVDKGIFRKRKKNYM